MKFIIACALIAAISQTAMAQTMREKCQKLIITKYEWGQDDNPKHPSLYAFIRNDADFTATSATFDVYFLISGTNFKIGEGTASIMGRLMSGDTERVPVYYTAYQDLSAITNFSFNSEPTIFSFSQ